MVLAFALVNGAAGLRLLGFSPGLDVARGPSVAPVVTVEDGVQVLRTFQLASGYLPEEAALYAGVPTRWVVESLGGGSCAIFLQVRSLGLAATLHEGETLIDLPPLDAGRIPYTCSMGMYGATLTVVDAPDGVLGALPPS